MSAAVKMVQPPVSGERRMLTALVSGTTVRSNPRSTERSRTIDHDEVGIPSHLQLMFQWVVSVAGCSRFLLYRTNSHSTKSELNESTEGGKRAVEKGILLATSFADDAKHTQKKNSVERKYLSVLIDIPNRVRGRSPC